MNSEEYEYIHSRYVKVNLDDGHPLVNLDMLTKNTVIDRFVFTYSHKNNAIYFIIRNHNSSDIKDWSYFSDAEFIIRRFTKEVAILLAEYIKRKLRTLLLNEYEKDLELLNITYFNRESSFTTQLDRIIEG